MSEGDKTPSEASQDSSLFGRVKQAVGLAPGPKEYKLDIHEHETEESPRRGETHKAEMPSKETTPQQLAEHEGASELVEAPPPAMGSSEEESPVTPTSSLQEESSRQGKEETLPQGKQQPQPEAPPPTPAASSEANSEKQVSSTATPPTPTPSSLPWNYGQRGRRREDLTQKVIEDMQARGFKRVTGSEADSAAEFYEQEQQRSSEKATAGEEKEGGVSEPVQGERVRVSRGPASFPGAYKSTTTTTGAVSPRYMSTTGHPEYIKKGGISGKAGGIQEVYARPDFEAKPMEGGEVAEMKAKEHAIVAEEASRRAAAKQRELSQLRREAEQLEEQSAALMEEADSERKRIETAHEKLDEIEQGEWRGYAQAERAEQERRAVIAKAKPAVRTAESREREAMVQKQLAADAQFHAQVLENRARSLLKESQNMAGLSMKLSTEASRVNSQLMIVRQEAQEFKQQIDTQAARGLPDYINECQREIGTLSNRIIQLREEIAWAEAEMERGREEADTWRRVVVQKEGKAARLLLQVTQLNENAEEARRRSKAAAEEARTPTELAEQKYEEAWAAAKASEEAEEAAKAAQQEALEVVKGTLEPEQERQRALRAAADVEAAAVQFETKAGMVESKAQRREHEAEVKEKTAAAKQEEAERTEDELAREKEVKEAEEKMAETYREQQKEHRAIAVPAI